MGRETNRQRRERRAASARQKAAASRAAQQRADQRRRARTILGSIVTVVVVGAVVAYIAIQSTGKSPNDRVEAGTAGLVHAVASVSPASLLTVGGGSATMLAKPTSGDPPLVSHGKPELLYVGGEFCPYCAAERWSMVQALSRFGKLSGLSQIHSAVSDGNLATFTFYKSSYRSKYLTFTPVEAEDRAQKQLEPLTAAQRKIFSKYTTGFPFLDFGGKYYQTNAGYDPNDLSGLSQSQIAAQLKTPTSKVAQDILGEANNLTATICRMTNNQPAGVCLNQTITNLQSEIGA